MAVRINRLSLEGVIEIIPDKLGDDRGFFSETYNLEVMKAHHINTEFVQDNYSWSKEKGVLRGLHFQSEPWQQTKLVRVAKGRIFDVAVDIRPNSLSFAKWVGIELSATKWNQLLIPAGFAHGFLTLEPDCEVAYKVSKPYSAEHDFSIRYDDPEIGITWPDGGLQPILSEKDNNAPLLREIRKLPK